MKICTSNPSSNQPQSHKLEILSNVQGCTVNDVVSQNKSSLCSNLIFMCHFRVRDEGNFEEVRGSAQVKQVETHFLDG